MTTQPSSSGVIRRRSSESRNNRGGVVRRIAQAPPRTEPFKVLCAVMHAFPQWPQRYQVAFWLALPPSYFTP
jgi:hypothetical protein